MRDVRNASLLKRMRFLLARADWAHVDVERDPYIFFELFERRACQRVLVAGSTMRTTIYNDTFE